MEGSQNYKRGCSQQTAKCMNLNCLVSAFLQCSFRRELHTIPWILNAIRSACRELNAKVHRMLLRKRSIYFCRHWKTEVVLLVAFEASFIQFYRFWTQLVRLEETPTQMNSIYFCRNAFIHIPWYWKRDLFPQFCFENCTYDFFSRYAVMTMYLNDDFGFRFEIFFLNYLPKFWLASLDKLLFVSLYGVA